MTELGEIEKNSGGFESISFWDALGKRVGFQATGKVVVFNRNMGLDRPRVAALVSTLQRWLDTGSFKPLEWAEVVVDTENTKQWANDLVAAFEACKGPTIIIVNNQHQADTATMSARTLYGDKKILIRIADPATLPVGECECGAGRAADDGRCGDGCDDD